MFWAVGGVVLWLNYLEKRYSTTAEEVNGSPRVAAVAEFHECEEFLGVMWGLPEVCSGLCHGGYTADQSDGEESCVEMGRGRRKGLPGVEGQVAAIPCIDGT